MKQAIVSFLVCLVALNVFAQTPVRHMLEPRDVLRMKQVRQPKVSPDGNWILYTVSRVDSIKDKNLGKLFMTSWDGKETVGLTEQTSNPGAHAWSPDGKYISFLASGKSDGDKTSSRQLYVMDRRGGEPVQLTQFKGGISSYSWAPKGNQLVFVVEDVDVSDTAKSNVRQPYEITRYRFKQDYEGYLDNRKSHLYLFDVATKKVDTLTRGNFDESSAVFSHDGNLIAYVSNTSADPDRNSNSDVFVFDLKTRKSRQVTTFKGSNGSPAFSPDDKMIAYTQSLTEENFNM
jgi:Tol biopolymer transport system component